ncbi:MAG: histidinol-phosphate transaminase [Desulfovibrionaceae bacterium]|nr:histidinol-phosphate transaminase [Desulfovibrionaceae bacterium]
MYKVQLRSEIAKLKAYTPGLSIDEIRQKYGLTQVIKMASNENPLGTSPYVQEVICRHAGDAFRYPRSGNPRLVQALASKYQVSAKNIVIGNGSDEVIDLLLRTLTTPNQDAIACFDPCFALYPIQAQIAGLTIKSCPLNPDFSFNFAGLLELIDAKTKIVFLTTPDNPSGFCPPRDDLLNFILKVSSYPHCLVVIDEAYMDFCPHEEDASLLFKQPLPDNVAIMRTFSKSYGLAGLRIGYAIVPEAVADIFWRARLPFSLNILAEEAALAALEDEPFHEETLQIVQVGREMIAADLNKLGCQVFPSVANFLMFTLPKNYAADDCFQYLLSQGIIIRRLTSYNLPEHLRVTIGNAHENEAFIKAMANFLA